MHGPRRRARVPPQLRAVADVFGVFVGLGLRSFGGPIAHLGYFRHEFVERRRWISDAQFAQLLAICQFLPGPASSQLGFGIGLLRAGGLGAIAAFVGFTLPSALLLFGLASAGGLLESTLGRGVTHGLKLAAVSVVAHGVYRMARTMTPDAPRIGIAAVVAIAMLALPGAWMQLGVIALGAALGALVLRPDGAADSIDFPIRYGRVTAAAALALFLLGLAVALWWPTAAPVQASLGTAFWRAGSLVFGGGHVVLPLLEQSVVTPGWVSADRFLAGYGAAQAIPGPMFSLAAYLGAEASSGYPAWQGALVATLAIFTPGFLLLVALLPAWRRITAQPSALRAVAGVNAAVVGLLAAALYDPVWTSGVTGVADIAVAAVGLGLLWSGRLSPLWCVGWCVTCGLGLALINVS